MRRYLFILFWVIIVAPPTLAEGKIDATAILKHVDKNKFYGTAEMSATMRIQGRVLREKTMQLWQKGEERAFVIFTNPEDEGTKYLKLKNQMWIYYPDVEEIIKISGHLLREGMMGSDFSYEDAMDNEQLEDDYAAKIIGKGAVDKNPCYILELTARRKNVSYQTRKIWVDHAKFVIRKMELYSLSGRLLKVMSLRKIKKIDGRYIAHYMKMESKLRKGHFSEFEIDSITLDITLPPRVFSKENLYN